MVGFDDYGTRPELYNQQDTYLPAAFDDARSWKEDGLILVLTDGVASVGRYLGPTPGPEALMCNLGSDVACLALRMVEYIKRGHALWILGMRLTFKGDYFVEEGRPRRPGEPQPVLAGMKTDGRPFYIWIGARSVGQGREIVDDVIKFARQRGIQVLPVEVAPGRWERQQVPSSMRIDDLEKPQRKGRAPATANSSAGAQRPGSDQEPAEFSCEGGGALTRRLSHDRAGFALLEVSARKSGAFGLSLPLREASTEPAGIPLLEFSQGYVYRLPRELPREAVNIKLLKRESHLAFCIAANPPLGLINRDIDIRSRWTGQKATYNPPPWDSWSTDRDDTKDKIDRTVNLALLFNHLQQHILPRQADAVIPPTSEEVLLRIQYRP